MPTSSEVASLIAAVAEGDRAAFQELYDLSSPKLYGVVLRILREHPPALEAMRRAYARIHAEAGTLTPQDEPVSWLVAIARSCAFDVARHRVAPHPFDAFAVPEPAQDPLARPEKGPALKRLLACIGNLPEERRRLVLLAYYDGWSREALSVYFDAPPAGVSAWIARSASQIAQCLAR